MQEKGTLNFMGYIIGVLINGLIFGFIAQHVAESKGYSRGFAWGFWLGVIGLLVVGFRPNRQTTEQSYTPMYGGALSQSEESKAKWTCVCGSKNREGLTYCPICRRTREEGVRKDVKCPHCGAMNNSARKVCVLCDKPLDDSFVPNSIPETIALQDKPLDNSGIELIEKLAKLHEQGILTDQEFSQKKADILSKL